MKQIFVIGTCDTKWEELHFVRDRLGATGVAARILDVSTTVHDHPVDIPATEVARYHPSRPDFLQENSGRKGRCRGVHGSCPRSVLLQGSHG